MSTSENIRARREQLGMKQAELAKKLGVAPSTIYRYENGAIETVNSEKLIPLAKALSTTPAALMGWNDDTPKREELKTPNIERAALKATQTLIDYHVSAMPIFPFSILQAMPDVIVVSFTEFADQSGLDRDSTSFGEKSQDVVTITRQINGKTHYSVAYNHRLPIGMLQFALARELGHIVLMHDESIPEDVQTTEALFFARYLLCPRPIIKAIQESGVPITIEVFGNLTGFYGRSLAGIRKTPGAHIPAELNKRVKEQFSGYIKNLTNYRAVMANDKSERATFGTYMDNYEE